MIQPGRSPVGEGWRRAWDRAWQVLRYYRWSQFARRASSVIWRRLAPRRRAPAITDEQREPTLREETTLVSIAQWRVQRHRANGGAARARELLAGRVRFLNLERPLPDPLDWRCSRYADLPRLWRFHLQYHEFLLDLATLATDTDRAAGLQRAWQLVVSWIDQQHAPDATLSSDAWHPYCVCKRLQAWILLWQASAPPAEARERILRSLAAQAAFLQRHLERDLGGNHLLENLRGLVCAAAFLDTPAAARWLRTVCRILPRQLDQQILPHGEHFERSPGYHAQMLELVLDLRDGLIQLDPPLARRCRDVAERMAGFLQAILGPDGQLPLLGDSSLGESPPSQVLLERTWQAERAGGSPCDTPSELSPAQEVVHDLEPITKPCRPGVIQGFLEAGAEFCYGLLDSVPKSHTQKRRFSEPPDGPRGEYWVFRAGEDQLLFDAGPVGAQTLPAHAHADLLSIQIWIAGRPCIVDSGVYDYEDSPMRRYCRSTAAHNTLEVDGYDQCDMWSRFRMGYRGRPTALETGRQDGGYGWARATHNAYRRLGLPHVGRWVACRRGGPWFVVDWLTGHGEHAWRSRLHLHPEVTVALDGDRISLSTAGRSLVLQPLVPGDVTLETGWYCPRMGHGIPAPVITYHAHGPLPAACGWQLSDSRHSQPGSLTLSPNDELLLEGPDGLSVSERLP